MYKYTRSAAMPKVETNTNAIIARLRAEGWVNEGGTKHDKFGHPT